MRGLKRKKQDRKPLVQSVKGSKQEGWRHVKRCPASPLFALSWTDHHCQQKVAEFWLLGTGIFPQSFLWRKLDSCTSYLSFLAQVHKCFAKFHTNETTPLSSRWRKLHDKEKRFKEYETMTVSVERFFYSHVCRKVVRHKVTLYKASIYPVTEISRCVWGWQESQIRLGLGPSMILIWQ